MSPQSIESAPSLNLLPLSSLQHRVASLPSSEAGASTSPPATGVGASKSLSAAAAATPVPSSTETGVLTSITIAVAAALSSTVWASENPVVQESPGQLLLLPQGFFWLRCRFSELCRGFFRLPQCP
ncbi:hypothetical protein AMECASPLE_034522 [Ameca splendens]|uniref:Uncharacterized protein n=1 Tax=Ameca splendens TaxID=208324 RepID=A0ABV0YIH8_9TELE